MAATSSGKIQYIETGAPAPWNGVERALLVAAHPDDTEYSCGGLIQRLHAWAIDVAYLVISDGDRGRPEGTQAREMAAIRRSEQIAAASVLGITNVSFLGFPDGELRYERGIEEQVVAAIRGLRPHVLITHDPLTRLYRQHPDHRAVGEAALAAAFPASRMATYYSEQLRSGLRPWTVEHALLYATDAPDWFVEINEEELDFKIRALQRHQSQAASFGDAIEQRVPLRAQQAARATPFRYTEGFKYVLLR